MKNDKWKMIRSLPLAVLTLSVKNKRGPTGVLSSPSLVLMKLIRTSLQDRKNQRPSHFPFLVLRPGLLSFCRDELPLAAPLAVEPMTNEK